MSTQILCDEPITPRCEPTFRVQASAWIDANNFGERSVEVDPPAGIRLRWTCPFTAVSPADRIGRPVSYVVERAGPLHIEGLHYFYPDVGHQSRAPTPQIQWSPLDRTDRLIFRVPGRDCRGVSAIAFSVPTGGTSTTVTLIDVDGVAQVVADVAPGEDFHFEWQALKVVSFSAECGVFEVIGLDLEQINADLALHFEPIAEIDAQVWQQLPLDEVSERVANGADVPFLTTVPAAWDDLRALGAVVDQAMASGAETPDAALGLAMASVISFETAALIGCGFVDGDHASAPRLDRIVGPLLDGPSEQLFAYRVRARLQSQEGEAREVESSVAFARAVPAPLLGDATCMVVPTPVARAELTNAIRPGQRSDEPEIVEPVSIRIGCRGHWDLTSDAWTVEAVLTRPVAQPSAVNGQPFQSPGTFLCGLNRLPRRLRGTSFAERREHRFDVPFFDSDVDCEIEASDFWDRKIARGSAGMVQPLVEYIGTAPPLLTAVCNPPEAPRGAEVDLTLDQSAKWSADLLAVYSRAKIVLMMRDSSRTPDQADLEAGPPSPTAEGQWSADLRSGLAQSELDRFVGGQISVGAIVARVLAMGPVQGGIARCSFEAVTSCAGADLYNCPAGWLAARLSEDPYSDRLWIRLPDTIDVLLNGAPAQQSVTTMLLALESSATLYFATRLEFSFEGQVYRSPMTVPVPAPYIHPAPPEPKVCLASHQLATDFYGRVVLRVTADHCQPFDADYAIRLSVAPGTAATVEAFMADHSSGIFAPQQPVDGKVLFEAFSRISALAESEAYTVGAFNVHTSDGIDSKPTLTTEWFRRIE